MSKVMCKLSGIRECSARITGGVGGGVQPPSSLERPPSFDKF